MPDVRRVAADLVARSRIAVTQSGAVVDPVTACGAIRLSPAARASNPKSKPKRDPTLRTKR